MHIRSLNLSRNRLTALPDYLRKFTHLQKLHVQNNQLSDVPDWLTHLSSLQTLALAFNQIKELPETLGELENLSWLDLSNNQISSLPESLGRLPRLTWLGLSHNRITTIPDSLIGKLLDGRFQLKLDQNPLEPELQAAYAQGSKAVIKYLQAIADSKVTLNEAKLILVGEGEVGKSSLLSALRNDPWEENRSTTHGIEIKQFTVSIENKEVTLNTWDFGGQRVYRPTHQLFFSAPAIYLVVWKPREGQQQGFVKEWIKLIKHREPDAKILVVATHGGPQQRQPDIDRQELWDSFGRDTIIDFFHVESRPDERNRRRGIDELKQAIARVASTLPEVGRSVPTRWQEVRYELVDTGEAFLSLEKVLEFCHKHNMDEEEAWIFISVSHRLGHLIHYQHDPSLRDIVILKPDWLAIAISFVLDDQVTREKNGLTSLTHLSSLWNDPQREPHFRYPERLHRIFLRLMERFDLSYRVTDSSKHNVDDSTSLIAQLVPDSRPEKALEKAWLQVPSTGDLQQIQICQIVDDQGQPAAAEGLFYQLIVRLHRFSLGRVHFANSVHWQRGLVIDDDYNGRALLEYVNNNIRITVRAAYPERFLALLTGEVTYLIENFWEGLRCDIMVPCSNPCGKGSPGIGLFNIEKLIESKRKSRSEYPCSTCNEWKNIDDMLTSTGPSIVLRPKIYDELRELRQLILSTKSETIDRFRQLNASQRELLSRVDARYSEVIRVFTDEAKEGPRLFSLVPVNPGFLDKPKWVSEKFRLTLWCEHSRLPLPAINGSKSTKGVYEIELTSGLVSYFPA